jgi:hypothetical protein
MKKIIDGILYNTETAKLIADKWNGLGNGDFNFLNEEIYQTKKERFFLFGRGGANTKYGEDYGNVRRSGREIIPLSENEVFEILQDWNEVEVIESLFPDRIEEA